MNYSMKNIPHPSEREYTTKLISMSDKLCRRMRWKAYFHLHPETKSKSNETYGFNSRKVPPAVPQLQSFENSLQKLVSSIKFKHSRNSLQSKLASDIKRITSSSRLFVPADKTTNYYSLEPNAYKALMRKAINKDYKKSDVDIKTDITREAKSITEELGIDDRVPQMAESSAFITLKDHKNNFRNNPSCRLLNPTKSEIGHISKAILDRINTNVLHASNVNQWKNTNAVINWFNNIPDKASHSFIVFDIVEFYPSITPELLDKALNYASQLTTVTQDDRRIIHHSKKSILIAEGQTWVKKTGLFDVAMGSYDGAECCELVGLFILHSIKKEIQGNYGLYRDDGLCAIKASPQAIEKTKKQLCSLFHKYDLKITVEANSKLINYLDVTLDLTSGIYAPYMKPNNKLLYVSKLSNHPPQVTNNIPLGINNRLCNISSDSTTFHAKTAPYQQALADSGYNHVLEFTRNTNRPPLLRRRKRKRNIIWFNPPFSKTLSTNIGAKFLQLLDKEFPATHILHSIFNRNTVKISYSCTKNMKSIIDSHNKLILANHEKPPDTTRKCNCRRPDTCPMEGQCLTKSIIYQATVASQESTETYIGSTATEFKSRYNNHSASFRHSNKRSSTELSKHIWSLKDRSINYNLTWSIIRKAQPCYNGKSSTTCGLCLTEKYYIIFQPSMASLNDRKALVSSCRHASKFLLSSFKS